MSGITRFALIANPYGIAGADCYIRDDATFEFLKHMIVSEALGAAKRS